MLLLCFRQKGLSLERLLEMENKNTRLLGRTISTKNLRAELFRKELGKYVDSNNSQTETSSWPLVKACRIRHNWPVRLNPMPPPTWYQCLA